MANALPQAIGAQFTDRGRQVVSMSGDGGFSMLMGDFLTLVQYDLPVKVVLFNNSSLGMVELEMLVDGPARRTAPPTRTRTSRRSPAPAGAYGVRVEKPKQLRGRAQGRLQAQGPGARRRRHRPERALHPAEDHAPSMVTGFALSASKIVLDGGVGQDGPDGPLQPPQHPAALTPRPAWHVP